MQRYKEIDMSYTPTTWTTGDTITASALNKIEQGIADGGGGGYPYVHATTHGFSNYVDIGYFAMGKYDSQNNHYYRVPASENTQDEFLTVNDAMSNEYIFPSAFPVDLPDGIFLLWVQYNQSTIDYTYSGEISQTLSPYYSDSGADGCRVVTGNFEITAVGV